MPVTSTLVDMTESDPSPVAIGRQLAARREECDLTQQGLADRIGISARTVSAVERGINRITKGKRSDWEHALELAPGTIGRAYRDGPSVIVAGRATHPASEAVNPFYIPHEAQPIGAREDVPDDEADEDPRLARAHRLLEEAQQLSAAAQQLLAEVRQDRQKGA